MLAGLTAFYAVGLRQEAKAEESVKALAQMMKTVAGSAATARRWRSTPPSWCRATWC